MEIIPFFFEENLKF